MNSEFFLICWYKKAMTLMRMFQVPIIGYTVCKFQPSCSEYAALAIHKHGPHKGAAKAMFRVLRCHPFADGGVDLP